MKPDHITINPPANRQKISFFILFLLVPILLGAQVKLLKPVVNPPHVKIDHLSPEDGMSSPFLECSHIDRFGYLWIGTQAGVDVYDGYGFRNIRITEPGGRESQLPMTRHICNDSDGGLWLCSPSGLYYFDREKDQIMPCLPCPEVPDSNVNSVWGIDRDSKDVYWVLTSGGVLHFNREKGEFKHIGVPSTPNWHNSIKRKDNKLLELEDGTVWIPARPNGLFMYDQETGELKNYRHDPENPTSLSSDEVSDVLEDRNGDLWITTQGGGLNILRKGDRNNFEHIRKESGRLSTDVFNTVIMDERGVLWFGGRGGFAKFEPDLKEVTSYVVDTSGVVNLVLGTGLDIPEMRFDPAGRMWINGWTGQGFLLFDPVSEELFRFLDITGNDTRGEISSRVRDIHIDRTGQVWIQKYTSMNRISMNTQKAFHLFSPDRNDPAAIRTSEINVIKMDDEGYLWLGGEGMALECIEMQENLPLKSRSLPINEDLSSFKIIVSLMEYSSGEYLIGSVGLIMFNRKTGKSRSYITGTSIDSLLSIAQVSSIFRDSRHYIWIGTYQRGLFVFDEKTGHAVNFPTLRSNGFKIPYWINNIKEDSKGNIWFSSFGHGIRMLDGQEISNLFTSDDPELKTLRATNTNGGLSSDYIITLYWDRSGRLWVGTTDGLDLYDPVNDRFFSFYTSDGLPGNFIHGILEDDHGNLWISTMKGICKLVLNEGIGPDVIQSARIFGSDGETGQNMFNEESCFKSEDGWMFFGGSRGLTIFHPDSIKVNDVPPPVYISGLMVNDQPYRENSRVQFEGALHLPGSSVTLPYRDNILSFEYLALNYQNPEKNQYKFMMEGLDEDWVDAGHRRFAEYRDLKPGSYTFRVIGSNEDGLWNEEGASLAITVKPPWYRTILAYLVYVSMAVTAVYVFLTWRTGYLRKEKEILEQQVRLRTTTIEEQKEEIMATNTELSEQKKEVMETNTQLEEQKEELEQQKEELEMQKEELQITLDRLKETQVQLIQSEKMAALGGLVAGVAHEINTPVGISLTAASTLEEETIKTADQFKEGKISKAEFKEYLNTANQSAKLILSNMQRTADMVQSFKQVSADQSTSQQRRFRLKSYTEDVIRSLYPKLKGRSVQISLDMDKNLEIDSFPGVFSQIITNLVLNSLTHGFEPDEKGSIRIISRMDRDNLVIEYRDDGKGILPSDLGRIFDPFFTTDKKTGTGLGLNILYNLVNQKLSGTVTCESKPGEGVLFRIELPADLLLT